MAEAWSRELRFSWISCRGVLWCASENWILEKGYLQLIRATFIKLCCDQADTTGLRRGSHWIWRIMRLIIMVSFTLANTFFPARVLCSPLLDQGPYLTHGWGEVVRLRHLYAVRPGVHLLISSDGQIRGSADQTLYSKLLRRCRDWWWSDCNGYWIAGLMEIRPVDLGCVVIRGAATARFLCIEVDGRLYSSVRISDFTVTCM